MHDFQEGILATILVLCAIVAIFCIGYLVSETRPNIQCPRDFVEVTSTYAERYPEVKKFCVPESFYEDQN